MAPAAPALSSSPLFLLLLGSTEHGAPSPTSQRAAPACPGRPAGPGGPRGSAASIISLILSRCLSLTFSCVPFSPCLPLPRLYFVPSLQPCFPPSSPLFDPRKKQLILLIFIVVETFPALPLIKFLFICFPTPFFPPTPEMDLLLNAQLNPQIGQEPKRGRILWGCAQHHGAQWGTVPVLSPCSPSPGTGCWVCITSRARCHQELPRGEPDGCQNDFWAARR